MKALLLERFGPHLGRPHADTLRLELPGEVWRVAFAFDPKRKAILLVAGEKSGKDQRRFYRKFISRADQRFEAHLHEIKKTEKK